MTNDITSILKSIKDEITAVENGDESQARLDSIRDGFLSLIELLKLFLISERDTYYGFFLMNMQFRADFTINSIAGIKLNTFPPVFEANPLLLCKFSLKEIIYIVCHEIDHVIFNHPAEMLKTNPDNDPQTFREFNHAADAAVNERLNREIVAEKHNFMAQPDGAITAAVLADMYDLEAVRTLESYAYYFELIHQQQDTNGGTGLPQNGQTSMLKKKEGESDSGEGKGASDGDAPGGNGESEGEAKQIVTAKNCGGELNDHDWDAGEDPAEANAAVKELVNAAMDTMNDETRGNMPQHFLSEIEKLNAPPTLSWQSILKKYVGTIVANKKKTRTRLNRRQPERFDISGTMDNKILKIVVAIDTSGSMSDDMLAQILNEIFAILAKRKHEITVIECDAEIQKVYRVKTPADIQNKVTGRGGTCFTPVIEYINEDKYYRDALLIYFTDGEGEPEIPKPKTYRNLWVVLGGAEHLSVEEPFGVVLSL